MAVPEYETKGKDFMGFGRFRLSLEAIARLPFRNAFFAIKNRGRGRKRPREDDDSAGNGADRKIIRLGDKAPPIVPVDDQVGLVVLVTDLKDNPLTVEDTTRIDERWIGKFWVPLIPSNGKAPPILKYALIPKEQLTTLESETFHLQDEKTFEEQVQGCLGEGFDTVSTLTTDYMEAILEADPMMKDYEGMTRIFGGSSAPSVSDIESMTYYTQDINDIRIRYAVCSTKRFRTMIPLSLGFYQANIQRMAIPPLVPELVVKAVGKNGSFPDRKVAKCYGHNTYVGKRTSVSPCDSSYLLVCHVIRYLADTTSLNSEPGPTDSLSRSKHLRRRPPAFQTEE